MGYLRKDNNGEPLLVRESRRDDEDDFDDDEEEESSLSELKERLSEEQLDSIFAWVMSVMDELADKDELEDYFDKLSEEERDLFQIGVEDDERVKKELERESAEMLAIFDEIHRKLERVESLSEELRELLASVKFPVQLVEESEEPEPLDEAFIDSI